MKKTILLFYIILLLTVLLAACNTNVAHTPFSATDCVGMNVQQLKQTFLLVGFCNVTEEKIPDLEITQANKNGTVEKITINGIDDFSGNQQFPNVANVVIYYHAIKTAKFPVSETDIKTMKTDDLINALKVAGFIDIETEEVFDLDPDTTEEDYENSVLVNGYNPFGLLSDFPLDVKIKITTHKAYKKCTLKLVIDFVPNLIFSKYDVNIDINGNVNTLKHGQDEEFEFRLKPNKYIITFTKVNSSDVKGSVELEIIGDTEASYKISCYYDEITVETKYILDKGKIGANEAIIPQSSANCKNKNYAEVYSWFSDAGFTNISTNVLYDISMNNYTEGEVENITIDKKAQFQYGDIISKDTPIVITYHMKKEDNPKDVDEEKYDINADVVLVRCDLDKNCKNELFKQYFIEFCEIDSSGNPIRFLTFSNSVVPREIEKSFDATGPFPSWFKVGYCVHLQANLLSDSTIERSKCKITESNDKSIHNLGLKSIGTTLNKVKEYATKIGMLVEEMDPDVEANNFYKGMKWCTCYAKKNNVYTISIEITYSNITNEVIECRIHTYGSSSSEEQAKLIKELSKGICPANDKDELLSWIDNNIGKLADTVINGIDYHFYPDNSNKNLHLEIGTGYNTSNQLIYH